MSQKKRIRDEYSESENSEDEVLLPINKNFENFQNGVKKVKFIEDSRESNKRNRDNDSSLEFDDFFNDDNDEENNNIIIPPPAKKSKHINENGLNFFKDNGFTSTVSLFLEYEKKMTKAEIRREERLISLDKKIIVSNNLQNVGLSYLNSNDKKEVIDLSEKSVVDGDLIIRELRKAIAVRSSLTKHQRIFIEIFIQANLRTIYGDDFDANELRIKIENSIGEIYPYSLICCPRRWGKTWSMAWAVACFLVCMRGIIIVVFSPAQRQSRLFVEKVKEHLEVLHNAGFEHSSPLGLNNQQLLGILRNGNLNKLHALPANENTTRGISANIVICEEAAALPESFFGKVIMPLLTVDKTALYCISTPQNDENFYSRLLETKNLQGTGAQGNVFQFYLACEACMEAGKAATCEHKSHEMPQWMNTTTHSLVRNMYLQMGQQDILEQETLGTVNSSHKGAFPVHKLKYLFTQMKPIPYGKLSEDPLVIYSAIDPTGGGYSDLAVATGIYDRGTFIYCGLESISETITPAQQLPYLIQHYLKVKALPCMRQAILVIFVERNTKAITSQLIDGIKNHPAMAEIQPIFPTELDLKVSQHQFTAPSATRDKTVNPNKTAGVLSTARVKWNMYIQFKNDLLMNRIGFLENAVTVFNPNPGDKTTNPFLNVKRMAHNQLNQYFLQEKIPADPAFQVTKCTLSGKGRGGRSKDDLAVDMQLVNYWSNLIRENPHIIPRAVNH